MVLAAGCRVAVDWAVVDTAAAETVVCFSAVRCKAPAFSAVRFAGKCDFQMVNMESAVLAAVGVAVALALAATVAVPSMTVD